MRVFIPRTYLYACALVAAAVGCNRRNQDDQHNKLQQSVPVPSDPYSNPAAATPERFTPAGEKENSGTQAADDAAEAGKDNLPQGYFHCPPPGTTPPSATTVEGTPGSDLTAIDCPPGDPNASSTRTGLPGTPSPTEPGTENQPSAGAPQLN